MTVFLTQDVLTLPCMTTTTLLVSLTSLKIASSFPLLSETVKTEPTVNGS